MNINYRIKKARRQEDKKTRRQEDKKARRYLFGRHISDSSKMNQVGTSKLGTAGITMPHPMTLGWTKIRPYRRKKRCSSIA